jgi:hypothetical protein
MSNENRIDSGSIVVANSKIHHAKLEDISKFTPEKLNHLRRGGIRQGPGRSQAEMQQLLDKIPPSERAGANGQSAAENVKQYLSNKDASHIKSHQQGGSSHPDNIKWENKSINRARGNRDMTPKEQRNIDIQAQFDNLTGAVKAGIQATPQGAAIGAITTLPFSVLSNSLKVVRGEISTQDAAIETAKETAIGAGVWAASAFVVTTVAVACPPVAAILTVASPYLLGVAATSMVHRCFQILDEHKKQVKILLESGNEKELKCLNPVQAELIYEREKILSTADLAILNDS